MINKDSLRKPDLLALSHRITPPALPRQLPQTHQHRLSQRRDGWTRQLQVLGWIACGFSLIPEIQLLIVKGQGGTAAISGAMQRVFDSLASTGLIYRQTLPLKLKHTIPIRLVRLTRSGIGLCRVLGWPVYETEWERMRRLHEKGKTGESAHTVAVLGFCYQARRWGYIAGVMPDLADAGRFVPDAYFSDRHRSFYVEVELGRGSLAKWQNMALAQDRIVFCTHTPMHRERLLLDAVQTGVQVRATDLDSLFSNRAADELFWQTIHS